MDTNLNSKKMYKEITNNMMRMSTERIKKATKNQQQTMSKYKKRKK